MVQKNIVTSIKIIKNSAAIFDSSYLQLWFLQINPQWSTLTHHSHWRTLWNHTFTKHACQEL